MPPIFKPQPKKKEPWAVRNAAWIDLFKWAISSVALVIVALIVESGFKERSTGIGEMQAFNNYVAVVLDAENPKARWNLAQFFSTVTPTDRLRLKWVEYKRLIEPEYKEFVALEKKAAALKDSILASNSSNAVLKLQSVNDKLKSLEGKLAENSEPISKLKASPYVDHTSFDLGLFDPDVSVAFNSVIATQTRAIGQILDELGPKYVMHFTVSKMQIGNRAKRILFHIYDKSDSSNHEDFYTVTHVSPEQVTMYWEQGGAIKAFEIFRNTSPTQQVFRIFSNQLSVFIAKAKKH